MGQDQDLLTPTEAAQCLRMDRKTLMRYVRAGLLPCIKFNSRKRLFRRSALEKFLTDHEK